MCGLAPSLGWLIFFRVLQGIGGGGLAPVEQAILVDTFPADKRAAAFALYSMAIVTAPAIGPPLGGWITDSFSWRWVFFINIPIGVISLILTSRMVSDPPEFKREVELARQAGKLSIDYIGIALVAIGFACLEVVLDRGEREDWFESHFILIFFAIAIVALVAAVIWELRYPDPVVELALLKERNFAISNAFYFMFGFTLFGSTVLIPQMLQSLYGYTATDAGLVLGPGALVIVVMAPFVVQLVRKISVAWLISLGFGILAIAMWTFASFNLATNYGHEAWARAIQGLGLAFLFVPTSQLAYSYLPKNKNNKASSLTNLFRNQGGSFGIAFVTTMISRRSQYHQNILVSHISNAQNAFRNNAAATRAYLMQHGFSPADAAHAFRGAALRQSAEPGRDSELSRLFLAARRLRADRPGAGLLHPQVQPKRRCRRRALNRRKDSPTSRSAYQRSAPCLIFLILQQDDIAGAEAAREKQRLAVRRPGKSANQARRKIGDLLQRAGGHRQPPDVRGAAADQ